MSVRLAFAALDTSAGIAGGGAQLRRGRIYLGQVEPDPCRRAGPRVAPSGGARPPGALGAAALAAVAAVCSPDLDTAAGLGRPLRQDLHADPEGQDRAEALYALYRPAYEAAGGARATNHAARRRWLGACPLRKGSGQCRAIGPATRGRDMGFQTHTDRHGRGACSPPRRRRRTAWRSSRRISRSREPSSTSTGSRPRRKANGWDVNVIRYGGVTSPP